MQLCCIPLRDLRYLRENIHVRVLKLLHKETPMSPADFADLRRQNPKTTITTRCSSLRYNAALLHSSAWSALSAGEYSRKSTQSIGTNETPKCLPQISQIYADETPKQQKQPLPQTTCLSLRDNAACCIPLRYLRYLRENNTQEYSIYIAQTKPQNVSRRSRRFTQTKPQNNKNSLYLKQPVFLCEIMQLAAFVCVICAICGRIHIQTYSINIHRRNPSVSRWSRRFTQTNNKTTKTAFTSNNLSFSAK